MTDNATGMSRSGRWHPPRDPLVWGVIGVYLALAVTYSYVMELGYAPDETSRHYPYVRWLAEQRCLPPPTTVPGYGALELHPPLYYFLLTPVYALARSYGDRVALRALRWTSPFLVLVAVVLWFAIIRRACADDRRLSLFAFALTAWWPNLFVDAGALNNDVGAIVASAALLYLVCVRHCETRSLASAAWWGGVVGLGALAKSSLLTGGVPVVAVALAWQHGPRFFADRKFWARAIVAGLVCASVCGWWYLRNLLLQGALIPVPRGYSLIPPGLSKLDALMAGLVWPLLGRAINGLWVSVFAGAVWFPDWSHPVVYGFLRALTVLGVLGVGTGLYRLMRGRVRLSNTPAAAIILPAVGFGALYLSAIWVSVFVHAGVYQGGRYLMVFLPGLTIPLALGLKQVLPRRAQAGCMIATALAVFALNGLAWYHLLTYWNPYVLRTGGPFQ